jgi:hypothetical protein
MTAHTPENELPGAGEMPAGWSRRWHELQRRLAADAPVQGSGCVRRSKLPRLARFPGGASVCWLARARKPGRVVISNSCRISD